MKITIFLLLGCLLLSGCIESERRQTCVDLNPTIFSLCDSYIEQRDNIMGECTSESVRADIDRLTECNMRWKTALDKTAVCIEIRGKLIDETGKQLRE